MRLAEVRAIVGDAEFEESMIALATTASSEAVRLAAKIELRKMFPSKHPTARKL
jgi:hypothetical protein